MAKQATRQRTQATHRETSWALGLELRQLRAFVLLVDAGSMTAAARALGVAQSTMSELVAALERAIGTRIVLRRRGGHGIALTPAGEALLPHARSVLASLEDAHVAVAAVDRAVRARIEVVANESISTYLLPPALGEMRTEWPNLRFAVTVGMCPSITEGLATARYDVGLMLQTAACPTGDSTAAPEADAGRLFLTDVPLVLFSAVGHPLASRTMAGPVRRAELATYTVFISDSRGYFFDLVRTFFSADAVPGPRMEPAGSVEAVKRSVLSDRLGLGVLPGYAVEEEVRTGRMRTLPLQPNLPRVRLEAMSYRTRPPAHPAVAALLDAVRRRVSRVPDSERARVRRVSSR
jgi:DNA-binding transcriptional LysR family regulator